MLKDLAALARAHELDALIVGLLYTGGMAFAPGLGQILLADGRFVIVAILYIVDAVAIIARWSHLEPPLGQSAPVHTVDKLLYWFLFANSVLGGNPKSSSKKYPLLRNFYLEDKSSRNSLSTISITGKRGISLMP